MIGRAGGLREEVIAFAPRPNGLSLKIAQEKNGEYGGYGIILLVACSGCVLYVYSTGNPFFLKGAEMFIGDGSGLPLPRAFFLVYACSPRRGREGIT